MRTLERKSLVFVLDRDTDREGNPNTMASKNNHDEGEKMAEAVARGARLRAARAYAGLHHADFAKELGMSVVTVKRMERGTRDTSLDDLFRLADLCNVPRAFMEFGWTVVDEAHSYDLREMSNAFIAALDARIAALTEALLTRDEALAVSRQALERLRERTAPAPNG